MRPVRSQIPRPATGSPTPDSAHDPESPPPGPRPSCPHEPPPPPTNHCSSALPRPCPRGGHTLLSAIPLKLRHGHALPLVFSAPLRVLRGSRKVFFAALSSPVMETGAHRLAAQPLTKFTYRDGNSRRPVSLRCMPNEQGPLLLLRREIVEIDGDVAGMLLQARRVDLGESAVVTLLNAYCPRVPVTLPSLTVLDKTLLWISLHWEVCQIVVGSARQVERGRNTVIVNWERIRAAKRPRAGPYNKPQFRQPHLIASTPCHPARNASPHPAPALPGTTSASSSLLSTLSSPFRLPAQPRPLRLSRSPSNPR